MKLKIVYNNYFETGDEQEIAWDKLNKLIEENQGKTKLFVSDYEELQSYMLWFGQILGLKTERTNKKTSYME